MKFCKDCRFYRGSYCYAPEAAQIDAVVGPQASSARLARKYDCGTEDAKFFQPRLIARTIQKLKGMLS